MPFDDTGWSERQQDLMRLHAARDGLASPGGWCQDDLRRGDARCLMGWLWFVADFDHVDCDRLEAHVLAAMPWWRRKLGSLGHSTLPSFNDGAWRTQDKVVALLDRAIALVERQKQRGT